MMEYTIFGESHGPAVGVLIQNIPAGLPVDGELIHADLLRRKASGALATGRHEPDEVELLAGVYQGRTTGDALVAVLRNRDVRSGDEVISGCVNADGVLRIRTTKIYGSPPLQKSLTWWKIPA